MDLGVPTKQEDWEREVGIEGLTRSSIHQEELESASNIQYKQYLMLRVLWKHTAANKIDFRELELDDWRELAKERLKDYDSWKRYCDNFGDKHIPERTFALVTYYQRQASKTETREEIRDKVIFSPVAHRTRAKQGDITESMRQLQLETPTKKSGPRSEDLPEPLSPSTDSSASIAPSTMSPIPKDLQRIAYPPTEDEQIVNTALLLFLNALTVHLPIQNAWTLHRKAFTATFKKASFEARTDGYLRDKDSGKARAIIEVKPAARDAKKGSVRMQESAQMVGWILNEADGSMKRPGRYVHLSQDRNFIYLTFAEFDENYVRYLKGDSDAPLSFLTMTEYGPWDTRQEKHMRHLAPILLALTLRAEADREAELTQRGQQRVRKGGLFG